VRCLAGLLALVAYVCPTWAEDSDADKFLVTGVQCPKSGDGRFVLLSRTKSGGAERVAAIYEVGRIKSLEISVAVEDEPFEAWLDEHDHTNDPVRKDLYDKAIETYDAIRREACLESGVVSDLYSRQIEANLTLLK
jgi:hypothetical protein